MMPVASRRGMATGAGAVILATLLRPAAQAQPIRANPKLLEVIQAVRGAEAELERLLDEHDAKQEIHSSRQDDLALISEQAGNLKTMVTDLCGLPATLADLKALAGLMMEMGGTVHRDDLAASAKIELAWAIATTLATLPVPAST